jgi:hypothetical protein
MTPKEKPRATGSIYRLKVPLKGIKPPIWRRIEVPGQVTS